MWGHALGIKLCQCLPVGVCYLPLCLVLSVHVYMLMVHSVTLAGLDLLPEDSPTGTKTCRMFYGIFSILMYVNMF